MSEQIVVRETARPTRRAVRTAATVIIAVGASGVVAQLAPHYGPLYVYLAALVALTWLEGIVVALLAAAGILGAYQLIIVPAPIDWRSWIIVGSLTGLVVLATKFVRHLRRPRAMPAPAPTTEVDELRAQLAGALAAVYEAKQLRTSEAAAAREREKRLCEQYEQENEHILAELERLRRPATPRRPLVLVVHHDPAMRTMSRDALDEGGFEIITAADGLEGLRLTVARKPDAVVADASMPKMDGRELCQLIKSNQETAGVKVVLLTADGRENGNRELGPDEMLTKPVKFDALRATLARLVGAPVSS